MTTPLRSNPITGPSSLLRTSPPLCPASVLRPSRLPAAWVSPFASGRQVPGFLIEACLKVTPPPCRTPVGHLAGRLPTLARGIEVGIPVSTSPEYVTTRHQRFTCVRLLETHLTKYSSVFSHNAHHQGSLPSQLVAVWNLPLQADSGGPSSIFDKASSDLMPRPDFHSTRPPRMRCGTGISGCPARARG